MAHSTHHSPMHFSLIKQHIPRTPPSYLSESISLEFDPKTSSQRGSQKCHLSTKCWANRCIRKNKETEYLSTRNWENEYFVLLVIENFKTPSFYVEQYKEIISFQLPMVFLFFNFFLFLIRHVDIKFFINVDRSAWEEVGITLTSGVLRDAKRGFTFNVRFAIFHLLCSNYIYRKKCVDIFVIFINFRCALDKLKFESISANN